MKRLRQSHGLTRREAFKTSGLALGGVLAAGGLGSSLAGAATTANGTTRQGSFFKSLPPCSPQEETLAPDEMRITFLGTWFCPRLTQAANSVYVEIGGGPDGRPADAFVFDCGSGVVAKYNALGISLSKMDKIFLTHFHADHMSDLSHIYCFGPAYDRKKPLYIWGPSKSNLPDPVHPEIVYEDGIAASCARMREGLRWHTESFGFQPTAYRDDDWNDLRPRWTSPDASPSAPPADRKDAYDLVPFELNWTSEGPNNVAYHNPATGVKITHFPVVHARQGAIGYKLEWNGLSMMFTGDTKPNNYVVRQAVGGVDVLIHEVTTSAEAWVEKFVGLQPADAGYTEAVRQMQSVQDSSHTEQLAFGYLLKKIASCGKAPRLAVGTHFPASDDTVRAALADIALNYTGEVAIVTDFVVLNVTKTRMRQRRAVPSEYNGLPVDPAVTYQRHFDPPKYNTWVPSAGAFLGDPFAQLDPAADVITPEEWKGGTVPACG